MAFSLDMFESKDFRKFIQDNFIVYKENNGIKVIDEEYTNEILNADPIDAIEKYLNEKGKSFDMENNFPEAFVAMKFNAILKEEISKANADTYRGQSLKDYISVAERLGFETIYDKTHYITNDECNFESQESMQEYLNNHVSSAAEIIKKTTKDNGWIEADIKIPEREMIFHHPEHNMLLHIDSYNGHHINSANLSFNLKERSNSSIYDANLPLSGGFTGKDSNIYVGSINAIDMLSHKITTILTHAQPLEKWLEFDESFYSHITHKNLTYNEDKKWDDITIEKMESFPDNVLNNLLEKNVKIGTVQNYFFETRNIDNDYRKMENFLNTLSDDDNQRIMAFFFVSDNMHNALSSENIETLEHLGIDKDRFDDYEAVVERYVRSNDTKEENIPDNVFKNAIDKSNQKDVEKMLNVNKFKFKLYPELENVKKNMEEKASLKPQSKRKLH